MENAKKTDRQNAFDEFFLPAIFLFYWEGDVLSAYMNMIQNTNGRLKKKDLFFFRGFEQQNNISFFFFDSFCTGDMNKPGFNNQPGFNN